MYDEEKGLFSFGELITAEYGTRAVCCTFITNTRSMREVSRALANKRVRRAEACKLWGD